MRESTSSNPASLAISGGDSRAERRRVGKLPNKRSLASRTLLSWESEEIIFDFGVNAKLFPDLGVVLVTG